MSEPVVAVAGLGRCGTSLVMQMLAAGGLPTVGTFPAFEVPDGVAQPGQAVKWIDPHRLPNPFGGDDALVVWLTRDHEEQARSQLKMIRVLFGIRAGGQRERFARSLERDERLAFRVIARWPVIHLTFEDLIRAPQVSTARLVIFLRPCFPDLDGPAMARCVLPRTSRCQPGVEIEQRLIAQAAP